MAINRDICKECGKVTLNISWSALRTHEECKQKGYLQRQGKRATLENTRNFFPGNVTDRVVRAWLQDDPMSNQGAMPGMVDEIMDREREKILEEGGIMNWKNRGDRDVVRADCIEAVTRIEPSLMKFVVPFEYQPDFKFKAPVIVPHPDGGMEGINLIGYMDIIVRDDKGRWWVWDVKHTRDDGYWRKTVGQLSFYDLAVELMFGAPTIRTGLLQPLCKKAEFPYEVTSDKRSQLMQRIVGMANDLWRDDKTPRIDNTLCTYCPVRHACSKFQPVVQADGKRRISF